MESRILHLAKKLRQREITSRELTSQYFSAIKAYDSKIHAYVRLTEGLAMEAAEKADLALQKGDAVSPLAGIPMAIKDNMAIR